MPKIIHICRDEKFINLAYKQFELLYPNQNQFYVYGCTGKQTTYIHVNDSYQFVEITNELFESLNDSIIIFHSIPSFLVPYLAYINPTNKVVWFLFGYETYENSLLYPGYVLLDKLTYRTFKNKSFDYSFKERMKYLLFPLIRILKKNLFYSKKEWDLLQLKNKLKTLQRVNYIGSSFEEEKNKQEKILTFKRPFFHFWYYPLELILDIDKEINLSSKTKIMIGHSGFNTGNHLDIIHKIKKIKIHQEDIIIPLSYGDTEYLKTLKPLITKTLPKAKIIQDFMDLQEYTNLLDNVKIAIFNNRRQQAIGNIISLIYQGTKVFLSEGNPFYHYLKRIGIQVYSYEKDLNYLSVKNGLSIENIKKNREILFQHLNEKTLLSELKESIEKITREM